MSTTTQLPSYAEGLKELQKNLSNLLPESVLTVFDKDATSLAANHTSILKVNRGDKAPDFALPNATGKLIELSELLKNGKVVLTFYRGSWCPYCNLQLNQYQQALPEIQELGAQLVAVSPQTPDESLNMQEKNSLQFEVLSDAGNRVTRHYTTVFINSGAAVEAMAGLGIDFNSHYSDDSGEIPVPAVFVIEQNGLISFARSRGGDYRNRVEVAELVDVLKNH